MGQAWPARDGRLALPAREIRPPMGAGTGHPAGAPAHAAGVGPLTLHVVQANLLPAPERRAHAEVLDQWHSLVDIAEIAASAGVRVSVVQASSRQDHLVRNGIEYHRSEEHTSELQSLMRISYAVFCLKKKKQHQQR